MGGLDEKLFELLWRKWRRRTPHQSVAVAFEQFRIELQHAADLIAGQSVELAPAEHDGGTRGDSILLPTHAAPGPEGTDRSSVYVFRIAYALESRNLGFHAPASVADDDDTALAALLATPRILESLQARWPGTRSLFAKLAADELERRPDLARLPPRTAAVEALHQFRLGRSFESMSTGLPRELGDWLELATASDVDPTTLRDVFAVLSPGLPRRRRRAPRIGLPLFGRLESSQDAARDDAETRARSGIRRSDDPTPTTEREARTRENVERVQVDQNPESSNPLAHVFEKLLTTEEYTGGKKSLDGSDELDDHAEALDDLQLRRVTRANEQADSLYRADIRLDAVEQDAAEAPRNAKPIAVYDEWHERKRRYRPGWCRVYAHETELAMSAEHAAVEMRRIRHHYAAEIRATRSALEQIERELAPRNRQRDGSDIDIDALVDHNATLRAARDLEATTADDERFYVKRRRHRADLATLVLLDTSLSTDAWVAGRRVLDVARDSTIVLGECLEQHPGIRIGIGAFFSNTRHECSFELVKPFDARWQQCHRRLLSLRPTGYTRIGPAIRHATKLLEQVTARKKLLLLLSDGKPSDYDAYEGNYGIADVRQALREARSRQIRAFGLTVESQGKVYLPKMFGPNGYRILPHARELAATLAGLQLELT